MFPELWTQIGKKNSQMQFSLKKAETEILQTKYCRGACKKISFTPQTNHFINDCWATDFSSR